MDGLKKGLAALSAAIIFAGSVGCSSIGGAVKRVSDSYITEFERISEYEYQSTFENGTTIYVNTDTDEVKVNGSAIDMSAYGLGVSE